jgi:hypothetical protein
MRPHEFQLPINRKKRKRGTTHPRPTLFGDIVLTAAELDAERYAQAMKQPDTRPDTSDSTNDAVDGGAVGDVSEESDTTADA